MKHMFSENNRSVAGSLLFVIGFASSAVQFLLLREASILGGGSEISTGVFLWLWLIISSLGAIYGGRNKTTSMISLMLIFISSLILSVLSYLCVTIIILKPGEIPSFLKTLAIISLAVAPVTFFSSFIFIRLTGLRLASGRYLPGNSFSLETAGSVAAGIFTTIFLSALIPNFQTFFVVLIIVSLSVITLLYKSVQLKIVSWILGFSFLIILFIIKPDNLIRGILLKGVQVETSVDTPYGNITSGMYGGERTVFYDHRPLFFSGDVARIEEDIHYTLSQRKNNEKIVLISGGIRKHIDQIKKYDVKEVVYIEHDPGIIDVENAANMSSDNLDLRIVTSDPVRYFRKNKGLYNTIIQLLPPPSTLSINRYFVLEYFREIKSHLSPGGVFMCTPLPYYKYSPESYKRSFSPIYNSLKKVFSNIIIIPGSQLYVIASDDSLSTDISLLIEKNGIKNEYVNGFYLDDDDIRTNSEIILSQVDRSSGLNTALKPVSTWFNNSLDLEMRGVRSSAIIAIILLMIAPFFFIRRGGMLMFSASAGLAGYGMIMIFILQMTAGSIYLLSTVVLTLLMAGLAIGASRKVTFKRNSLIASGLALALLYSLTGILAGLMVRSNPWLILSTISVALLTAGFITGNIYMILTTDSRKNLTGKIYASDLAGAALGYMLVSTVLVPLAGITSASFILSAFILTSVALVSVIFKH